MNETSIERSNVLRELTDFVKYVWRCTEHKFDEKKRKKYRKGFRYT